MKKNAKTLVANIILLLLLLVINPNRLFAQSYDLLLKGGHVIDPKNGINNVMDVAVKDGKIVEVASNIAADQAATLVDATGLYVTPGLIDMHVHVFHGTKPDAYLCNSFSSLPPDGFTFRAGVTTVVDAGCAGWKNFEVFKEQTIDRSKTRILAFLNIVGAGMAGGEIEQNLEDMDAQLTANKVKEYPGVIVGVKLAHYSGPEWDPLTRSVEAGRLADVPVMVDFGGNQPPLSLERLLLEEFRPGDIFTHCYANVKGRTSVVDENGKVRPYVMEAQKKGIVFDVGHGGGSLVFDQAIPAIEQGFKPDAISTDLHTGSMNAGMKSQLNVMSKMLNIGLNLEEVIDASTWKPARYVKREDLGNLSVGAEADITLLRMEEGKFGYLDVRGWKIEGSKKLVCELTIREGAVVWDLNGISRPAWQREF